METKQVNYSVAFSQTREAFNRAVIFLAVFETREQANAFRDQQRRKGAYHAVMHKLPEPMQVSKYTMILG